MSTARFTAYACDGDGFIYPVKSGTKLTDFRNEVWTYVSTTHPRKVNVSRKEDPAGSEFWPNKENREFYASVFELGIWDNAQEKWTFTPSWDHPDDPTIFDDLPIPDKSEFWCSSLSCQGPWWKDHTKDECK